MNKKERIWVVDDDQSIRWVLEKAFQKANLEVTSFDNGASVLKELMRQEPDAIISDIRMPGMDGLDLLKQIHLTHPALPIIIMTAHSDLDAAVSAYQSGAFEYLPKPFDVNEAVAIARRAIHHRQQQESVREPAEKMADIIGEAPSMQEVFRAIGRLSRSNVTVLITGESGTGKELVALALHRHSLRNQAPFIALNTAAIPKDLLESELFGHERGAFTGANTARKGRFEQANRGTLFLDEIGDMPAELQTRLLRVLADGEFYPVGAHTAVKVDVRIIAATHQNLEKRVEEGVFREDLFHRLNVIRVHMPPLRERQGDIPKLASYFLLKSAEELKIEPKSLRPEVENYLKQLTWKGNVRQLENTCRWLTVMSSGREIHLEDLPPELKQDLNTAASDQKDWIALLKKWADQELLQGRSQLLDEATPLFERTMIEAAMRYTSGKRQEAAKLLGWGRNTLTRKISELGLEDL